MVDFQEFKNRVSSQFNLSLNSYKETQLKRRIDNLISRSSASDYNNYFSLLTKEPKEFEAFLDYVTINVSEFFRNPSIFNVLENQVLPELSKKTPRLKVWSAACSIGCEPYSIAMILEDMAAGKSYQIDATDIDEGILKSARLGLYSSEHIKNISTQRLKKYFVKVGEQHSIQGIFKSKIHFKKHDLLLDSYAEGYDLIVCRNVTIYFTKEAQDQIYRNFSKSLKVGGYLFIGGTENIFNYKDLFLEKVSTSFYRKV